jgi:nitrite reductase/ring-hydroxylating ferredoxin subunit
MDMPTRLSKEVQAIKPLIPKGPYLSREFLQGEKERLWPNVWLMACRESEVAGKGRFTTFNIADESIIVVRGAEDGVLRAFFNACQHRGRRLVSGSGRATKFVCKYHGWRWKSDGSNEEIIDQADWGESLCQKDVALKALAVDTWGGWVFVHMQPDRAEPLREYLEPVAHAFRHYKFEEFSPVWRKTVTLPCNWKLALDVFIEGYHAMTAHRQFNPLSGDNRWTCELHGLHSMFHSRGIPVLGDPCPHLGVLGGLPEDEALVRSAKTRAEQIYVYFMMLNRDTGSLFTDRKVRAMKRLAEEMPADADYMELLMAMDRLHREEGRKDGIEWDAFTLEDIGAAGLDWNIFPNVAFLPQEDGALVYRARPNGDDPHTCIFDIYAMERFAPGTAPDVEPEIYDSPSQSKWPLVFMQDFENLPEIHAGIKSRGFEFGRPNPIAELTCANFHYHVRRYVTGSGELP